ncbi:hypothetical protein P153DRAFT_423572 [Dothidotthia symphoricarpi CBS 119687]|uniref:UBA domain-containing protein n=1 Tax=Dothidotthia symphoricarpi CBS 119687 TaxID=1392245 RepID=A0A6A6AAZ9_9PLEO|nr:uncharacterized protein P153DRAFT_423572 [Dothidotthia symphoricarpi CBS 119687]KAF2128325.1 hypothetical protein P153DRAFT_423572 [Dothidotthia symphoricarpi CBS 119687]
MAGTSNQEKIAQLREVSFWQLDHDEAAQLLKISNNDVAQAAEKFYDAGDISNVRKLLSNSVAKWDGTAFGADRYGQQDAGSNGPSFDNYPHSGVQSRAPTRPPSRSSQHSNLSTHLGDAPIESIEMQESGVIGGANAAFGPATKEHYETSQWAMVPTTTAYIPDPTPTDRMRERESGKPPVLKPSPNFNYLPLAISILHSIPLFRNALLSPGVTQKEYWLGDDWWKGSPTASARVIDLTTGIAESHGLEILYEAQRLMAFLDNTDRAYASVESLLSSDAWKESNPTLDDPDDDLLKFLLVWSFAYQSQVPGAQLDGVLRSTVNIANDRQECFIIDANVTRIDAKKDLTIYDALDDVLFSSGAGSAHIDEISNVLIIRLTSSKTDASDLGCRVPATLYVDRYLDTNRHIIDSMYRDMKQYEDQLIDMDTAAQRLKYHTPKNSANAKQVDSLKLLQTSMKAFQPRTEDEESKPEDAAVLSQLQTVYESIKSKLETLDQQSKEIRETLSNISNRFKPTVDDGAETPQETPTPNPPQGQSTQDAMKTPYHLAGVATRRDVVYLLHPVPASDPPATQWWRIQYDAESASPTLLRNAVPLSEVIERATTESASALLIYANDAALTAEPAPLPTPLADFVKADNVAFMHELQAAGTADWNDTYGDGAVQQDGWPSNPPEWDYTWSNTATREFRNGSATLTPDTEVDGGGEGVTEMVEVNGGMAALAGLESSASSDTVGAEGMDVDGVGTGGVGTKTVGKVSFREDVEMVGGDGEGVRVQHVEVAEKKGGGGGSGAGGEKMYW